MTNSDKNSMAEALEASSSISCKSRDAKPFHPLIGAARNAARAVVPLLLLSGPLATSPSCQPDSTELAPVEESQPETPKFSKKIGNWRFDVMEITETTFKLEVGQKYF